MKFILTGILLITVSHAFSLGNEIKVPYKLSPWPANLPKADDTLVQSDFSQKLYANARALFRQAFKDHLSNQTPGKKPEGKLSGIIAGCEMGKAGACKTKTDPADYITLSLGDGSLLSGTENLGKKEFSGKQIQPRLRLSGATVTLKSKSQTYSAITGPSGEFLFDAVVPGLYYLTAAHPDYEDQRNLPVTVDDLGQVKTVLLGNPDERAERGVVMLDVKDVVFGKLPADIEITVSDGIQGRWLTPQELKKLTIEKQYFVLENAVLNKSYQILFKSDTPDTKYNQLFTYKTSKSNTVEQFRIKPKAITQAHVRPGFLSVKVAAYTLIQKADTQGGSNVTIKADSKLNFYKYPDQPPDPVDVRKPLLVGTAEHARFAGTIIPMNYRFITPIAENIHFVDRGLNLPRADKGWVRFTLPKQEPGAKEIQAEFAIDKEAMLSFFSQSAGTPYRYKRSSGLFMPGFDNGHIPSHVEDLLTLTGIAGILRAGIAGGSAIIIKSSSKVISKNAGKSGKTAYELAVKGGESASKEIWKLSSNPAYYRTRGWNRISDEAKAMIQALEREGGLLRVPKGQLNAKIMAEIQHSTSLEVSLLRLDDGNRYLFMGTKDVLVDLSKLTKRIKRIVAHTHPGIRNVQHSWDDYKAIFLLNRNPKQTKSLIISEEFFKDPVGNSRVFRKIEVPLKK